MCYIKKSFLFFIVFFAIYIIAQATIMPETDLIKKFGLNDKEGRQADQNLIKKKELPEYPAQFKEMDIVSAELWKKFKLDHVNREELFLDISYLGITAGELILKVDADETLAGKKVVHTSVKLKSAEIYKLLFEANDFLDSYILKDSFVPIKYSLIQNEKGKKVSDIQLFDHEKLMGYFFSDKSSGKKENKKGTIGQLPKFFHDSLSSIAFLTGLPLKKGDKYKFPIIDRVKPNVVVIEVFTGEEIEINGKKIKTVKLNANGLLSVIKKQRKITFWFSDDEFHRLVKFEAELNVGTITGSLTRHRSF